jgi:hypothetical protein
MEGKPLGSLKTRTKVPCSKLNAVICCSLNWEETMMDDDEPPKTAEYQGRDVDVLSRAPLIGTLELMGDDDEPIDLQLDRASAEALMATLTIFLLKGEGEDAPSPPAPNEH